MTIAYWYTRFPFRISRYRNYGAFHDRQIPKRHTLPVSVLSELSERAFFRISLVILCGVSDLQPGTSFSGIL